MHATTATPRDGRPGGSAVRDVAYWRLLAIRSSVADMAGPLGYLARIWPLAALSFTFARACTWHRRSGRPHGAQPLAGPHVRGSCGHGSRAAMADPRTATRRGSAAAMRRRRPASHFF